MNAELEKWAVGKSESEGWEAAISIPMEAEFWLRALFKEIDKEADFYSDPKRGPDKLFANRDDALLYVYKELKRRFEMEG